MTTLSAYVFGYQLQAIRYPYLASLHSALALTEYVNGPQVGGRVVYCHCTLPDEPVDDSLALIQAEFPIEIERGQLKILYHLWGSNHTIQAYICNYILDQIGTSTDYALKLDADEVIHEDSFESFKADLNNMARGNHILGRPHYTHFSPDFWTTWPFIYASKAVLVRTSFGLRFGLGVGGDACALGGAPEVQTGLEIQHFGKVQTGREREALKKEWDFQQLYTELGFPDPLVTKQRDDSGVIDYNEIFHVAKERGEFSPFLGTHPLFIQSWIEMMEEREAKFQAAQKIILD